MRTQKAKVILLSVGAAVAYGIVHDEITARVCVEYFSLAHPPLFPFSSPTMLGLCWGAAATFGVGLVLGYLLAQASQSEGLPGMPIRAIVRPLLVLLAVTGLAAAVAGYIGYRLAESSVISLPALLPYDWVESLPRARQDRFLAVWFAHGASYFFGLVAGSILIFRIWNRRGRPRLAALFPRTVGGLIRAVVVLAVLGGLVWLRWFR